MRALISLRLALLPALLAGSALVAQPAQAQAPPLKLALELNAKDTVKGDLASAQSVARQAATHMIPQLEAQGWQVVRVYSAKKAAKSGRFHAAARIDLDARPVFHIRDARLYEDETGRAIIPDYSKSVETWGNWMVWDGAGGKPILDGEVLPLIPQLQSAGAGRPEFDDEASMARLLADAAGKPVATALSYTRAAQN